MARGRKPGARSIALAAGLFALVIWVGMAGQARAAPDLTTEDLTGALTPEDLANDLVGEGITISNVVFTGVDVAAGTFGGGTGIVGFESGSILSSGDIANVVGPNTLDDVTLENGAPGDTDLEALSGFETFDATVLEFDFVPVSDAVAFQYVFASDEYNEFVNTEFNDVFAFFINGVNCATVGGDPVSINTINNGNPEGDPTPAHPELYRNNDLDDGGGAIDTEMDGLTEVLTCQASVSAGETNHIKLAIADASDEEFDSNVFLQTGSFVALPIETPTPTNTAVPQPTSTPQPTATLQALQLPGTGGGAQTPTSGGLAGWFVGLAGVALALGAFTCARYALARRRRG